MRHPVTSAVYAALLFLTASGCSSLSDLANIGRSPASGSGTPVWERMNPAQTPSPRNFHAICYDSLNRVVILFGGKTNNDSHPNYHYTCDTWAYLVSQNVWSNMNPTVHPSARHRHAMCFDSFNRKAVLFGGDDSWYSNDTWTYDYASNSWSNMNPPNPPPGRYYHSLCYDSHNRKVILFGGAGPGQYNDTWAYDYASNTWSNMNPATHPSARYQFSMAYDSDSRKAVLFGGRDNSTWFSDTWAYDYTINSWVNRNPSVRPSARSDFSMCYDSVNRKTVLFGGWDQSTGLNDVWTYDDVLNRWSSPVPPALPAGRADHAICFDSLNQKVILFGGWTNNLANFGYAADTWTLTAR